MTIKHQIQRMIDKLPDDVGYDRVIYHLQVMREVQIGLDQADRGEVIDHDDLMAELDAEDAKTEVVHSSKETSGGHTKVHRSERTANGAGLRGKTKGSSRKAK